MVWGIPGPFGNFNNARVESITEKPTFSHLLDNRCFVVVDGFIIFIYILIAGGIVISKRGQRNATSLTMYRIFLLQFLQFLLLLMVHKISTPN